MKENMKAAGVGLACLVLGELALLLSVPPGFFVPVWPAAGIAVAATAMWGRRMLVPVGLATLIVAADLALRHFHTTPGEAAVFALCAAIGSTLQGEVGLRVLRRISPDRKWTLETGREILLVTAVAGPLAAIPMAVAFPVGVGLAGLEPAFSNAPVYLKSWLSSATGIVLVTPLALLVTDPEQISRRRKLAVAAPAAILLAIALTVFFFSRADGVNDRHEAFAGLVARDQQAITENLDRLRHRLTQLGGLFAASETVTEDEFDVFVSIAFSGNVQAEDVRWAPRLSDPGDAAEMEHQAFAPDTSRQVQVFPLAQSGDGVATSMTGVDMPGILDAILDGAPVVVRRFEHGAPMQTREAESHRHSLLLAAPAYAGRRPPASREERLQQLTGVALGRITLSALVANTMSRHEADYRLAINDLSSGDAHTLLGAPAAMSPLSVVHQLDIGDLSLEFIYTATPGFIARNQDLLSWATLITGLAFITVLNALTLLSTARADLVQRLVVRKTAEAESLSRNLSLILENAADGILGIGADGVATIVNPAAARLLGYAPEELTGTLIHDIIHPVDSRGRPHSRADCPMVSSTRQEPVRNGVEPFRRRDGSSFTAEFSSEPMLDAQGRLLGVVTVFRDITDRQQAQAERERFIAELSRANEELERFAFAASHDLQEPLRLISNFNALLARRYDSALDDAGRSYIQHSIKAAERMQALIADLLAYGRLNYDSEPREVDVPLGDIAEDAIRNLQTAIDKTQARIEISDLPSIRGSRAQLTQLMQNLIGNAIKYHRSGNAVHVSVDAHEEDDVWRISVADNGIGIAPQYREQIFHPFKRLHAKDEYSGTGMGLAICRKIIESHGGVLWVEESPSGGSLFLFTLPKAIEPTHDQR